MLTHRSSLPYSVVVPLDGSERAASAIPLARVVASQLGAAVEGLQVGAPGAELAHSAAGGLPVHHTVGDPAAEILRATDDPAVALVVLTTRGATGARETLGPVAVSGRNASPRPLLALRPETATGRDPRPLRHVLVPLDGTPGTARALHTIATLIHRLGASLDVLLIAAPGAPAGERGSVGVPRYIDQPQHEWPQWCAEVVDRLCLHCAGLGAATPAHVFLAHGPVDDAIIQIATAHEHDAMILVRRSHLEPGRGDILRALLARTPCPILLAPAPLH